MFYSTLKHSNTLQNTLKWVQNRFRSQRILKIKKNKSNIYQNQNKFQSQKYMFASDVFSEPSHHQWSSGWCRERGARLTEKWSGRAGGRFKTQKILKIKKTKQFQSQKNSKVKKIPKSKIKARTRKNHQKTRKLKNILHELRKKPLKRKRRAPGVRSFNLSPSRLQTKPGELFLSEDPKKPPFLV